MTYSAERTSGRAFTVPSRHGRTTFRGRVTYSKLSILANKLCVYPWQVLKMTRHWTRT
jgi:hypothetical protein